MNLFLCLYVNRMSAFWAMISFQTGQHFFYYKEYIKELHVCGLGI